MALVTCQTISGQIVKVEEGVLLPRPCAYALIMNNDRELLVEDTKDEGGKYWFIGGGLETNEKAETALIREAKEEAGVNIKVCERLTSLEYCYYHNKLNTYYRCNSDFYYCEYISSTGISCKPGVKTRWLKIHDVNDKEFHLLIRKVLKILREKYV